MVQLSNGSWTLDAVPGNVGRRERCYETGPTRAARPAFVPGSIQQAFPGYHGMAWYWLEFTPDLALGPNRRWRLHSCGGVDYFGEVWLNGLYLGIYEVGCANRNRKTSFRTKEEELP